MLRLPGTGTMSRTLTRSLPGLLSVLGRVPRLRSTLSRLVIADFADATTPRPRALSLAADYTSWRSLTDRTFSGRHLPPSDTPVAALPDETAVRELFRRRGAAIPSYDTSTLFMFFAQWFTDSFLRTDRGDPRKNTSNHEIDLCQIYGLTDAATRLLRSPAGGGRLRSQLIDGEEWPEFLFERRVPGGPLVVRRELAGLHDAEFLTGTILGSASTAHADTFFAVGLEHGNSTIGAALLNVVFLREHNRIADQLAAEHAGDPAWDDDRIFETTRNTMIVLLLDLVVEEYIRHIAPFDVPLENVRGVADGARWNRSNWCAIEFNLLYRWHSLVPDAIGDLGPGDLRDNNPLVIARGVEELVTQLSAARAGRIGLGNTPRWLVDRTRPDWPSVEERTIALMRSARLRSYNDYREHFGLRRLAGFEQLTSDIALRARLEELYGDIDAVEWYVGIFAEDYPEHAMMGGLLTTMVAYDAFTQALTNPLLAREVYREETFSPTGMRIIEETSSLQQIVARNVRSPERVHASFSCGPLPAGRPDRHEERRPGSVSAPRPPALVG